MQVFSCQNINPNMIHLLSIKCSTNFCLVSRFNPLQLSSQGFFKAQLLQAQVEESFTNQYKILYNILDNLADIDEKNI